MPSVPQCSHVQCTGRERERKKKAPPQKKKKVDFLSSGASHKHAYYLLCTLPILDRRSSVSGPQRPSVDRHPCEASLYRAESRERTLYNSCSPMYSQPSTQLALCKQSSLRSTGDLDISFSVQTSFGIKGTLKTKDGFLWSSVYSDRQQPRVLKGDIFRIKCT